MQLSSRLDSISESLTLQLNAEAEALQAQGERVWNLTAGELDFETPAPVRKAVSRVLDKNRYTPALGMGELREELAVSVQKQYRIQVSQQNIAVMAGAKQVLYCLFQVLLDPGDEVIVPLPGWVSYDFQIKLAGGVPVHVPLKKNFDLDAARIASAVTGRTKAVIINSPHNPTGAVFSDDETEKVVKLCEQRGIMVIADDIYNQLVYGTKPAPATKFAKSLDFVAIVNGFSKSHALTGWRIGYVAANKNIIGALNKFVSHTSGNAAVPSQYAALASLKDGTVTAGFVTELKKRRKLCTVILKKSRKISFTEPQGAFYFFIDIRKITKDSANFCRRLLLEAGVAAVPGEAFGSPGFVRLSFAADTKTLKEGYGEFVDFCKGFR